MARSRILRPGSLALLAVPLLVGCAALNAYRSDAVVTRSRFTTIENYSTAGIDPDQVDALLLEVANLLAVQLDGAMPPPRVVVTNPSQIARLYSNTTGAFSGHLQALALYFPGARLIMIPYFDRALLGHEFAHYLTEHYLAVPRSEWEPIAHRVQWKLATTWRARTRPPAADPGVTRADPAVARASAPAHVRSVDALAE